MLQSSPASSNFTSISKRIPQFCSSADESNKLTYIPTKTLLNDERFWQWQTDKNYINSDYEDSAVCSVMQNRSNDVAMIPIHIYNWFPDLVNGNLIISGVNELESPISFIVKSRISSLIFKTEDQYNCCLSGRISNSANVPKFIRDKFTNHGDNNYSSIKYGIPENWKEVCILWKKYILTGYSEDVDFLENDEQDFYLSREKYEKFKRKSIIPSPDSDPSTLIVNFSYGGISKFNSTFEKQNITAEDKKTFYESICNGNNCVIRKSFHDVKIDETLRNTFIQSDDETNSDNSTEDDFTESDSTPDEEKLETKVPQANKSCISSDGDTELIRRVILEVGDNTDVISEYFNSSFQQTLNEENAILSDVYSSDDDIFSKPKIRLRVSSNNNSVLMSNKSSVTQEIVNNNSFTENYGILSEIINNDSLTSVLKELEKSDISPARKGQVAWSLDEYNSPKKVENSSKLHLIQTDRKVEGDIYPKKVQRINKRLKNCKVQANEKLYINKSTIKTLKKLSKHPDSTVDENTSPNNVENINNRSKNLLLHAREKVERNNSPVKAPSSRNTVKKLSVRTDDKLDENILPKKNSLRKSSCHADEKMYKNNSPTKPSSLKKQIDSTENENTSSKNGQNISSCSKKLLFQTDEKIDRNNSRTKSPSSRKTSKKLTDGKLDENISPKKSNRRKSSLQTDAKMYKNNSPAKPSSLKKQIDSTENENTSSKNGQNFSRCSKKFSLQTGEKIDRNNSPTKAPSSRTTSKKLTISTDDKLDENISSKEGSYSSNCGTNLSIQNDEQTTNNVFKTPQKVSGKIKKVDGPSLLIFESSSVMDRSEFSSFCSGNISISSRGRIRKQTSEFWIGFQNLSNRNSSNNSFSANSTALPNPRISTSDSFNNTNNDRENRTNYSSSVESISDFYNSKGSGDSNNLDKKSRKISSAYQNNSGRFDSGEPYPEPVGKRKMNTQNGNVKKQNKIECDSPTRKIIINEKYEGKKQKFKAKELNGHSGDTSVRLRNSELENTGNKEVLGTTPKTFRQSLELIKSNNILTRKNSCLEKEQNPNQSKNKQTLPKRSKESLKSVKSTNLTKTNSSEHSPIIKKIKEDRKQSFKRKLFSENSTSTTELNAGNEETRKYPVRSTAFRINYNEDCTPNINFISNAVASMSNESVTEKPKKKNARLEDTIPKAIEKLKSSKNMVRQKSELESKKEIPKKSPRKSIKLNGNNIRNLDNKFKTRCYVLIPEEEQFFTMNTSNFVVEELRQQEQKVQTLTTSTSNFIVEKLSKQEQKEHNNSKTESFCTTLNSNNIRNLDNKFKTRCYVLIPEEEQFFTMSTSNFVVGELRKQEQKVQSLTKSTSNFIVEKLSQQEQKELNNSKRESFCTTPLNKVGKTIVKKKVKKYKKKKTLNLLKTSAVELESYMKKHKKFTKKTNRAKIPTKAQPSSSSAKNSPKRRQLFNADKWLQSEECFEMLRKEVGPERKSFVLDLKND